MYDELHGFSSLLHDLSRAPAHRGYQRVPNNLGIELVYVSRRAAWSMRGPPHDPDEVEEERDRVTSTTVVCTELGLLAVECRATVPELHILNLPTVTLNRTTSTGPLLFVLSSSTGCHLPSVGQSCEGEAEGSGGGGLERRSILLTTPPHSRCTTVSQTSSVNC